VVEDQRVAVLILEKGLVADAAVHCLALELHATGLEFRPRGLDILDVQGDRALAGLELATDLGDVDQLNRAEAAGLELASERVVA